MGLPRVVRRPREARPSTLAPMRELLLGERRNTAIAVTTLVLVIAIGVSIATGFVHGGGSSSSTFDAQGFVDAANDEGAGLALGDSLFSGQKDTKVYAIGFEDSAGPAPGGEEHGSASLTISKDADAATAVYQQCESAGNFTCYRANNAALVFDEGSSHDDVAKVDAAIRAMAKD
jgi:hypothetical protein